MVRDSAVVKRSLPNPSVVSSNPGWVTFSSPSWKWLAKSLWTKIQVVEKGIGRITQYAKA